jgi:hypothetical protein
MKVGVASPSEASAPRAGRSPAEKRIALNESDFVVVVVVVVDNA